MKRTIAAGFITAGFLLAGAAQAAQPLKPPVPPNARARLACNNVKDPGQRNACIAKACAAVPAPLKKACADGVGPYAAKPPVKPPVIGKPVRPPVKKPVIGKPVKPPVKKPVVGKPKQPAKPPVALLNQKRAQLSKLRNEVVSLCRRLYEGKAEQACIAGLFPPAPGAPPLRKPAN